MPLRRCAEQQRVALIQLLQLGERLVDGIGGESELVVLGEIVGAGRPQRHAGENAPATVVTQEEALHVAGRQRRRGGDQVVERLGRIDTGFLEQALAIDQQLHVESLRNRIQVAVERQALQKRLVEVTRRITQDVIERQHLAGLDHVDRRPVAVLEHIGSVIGEQRARQRALVAGRAPTRR